MIAFLHVQVNPTGRSPLTKRCWHITKTISAMNYWFFLHNFLRLNARDSHTKFEGIMSISGLNRSLEITCLDGHKAHK